MDLSIIGSGYVGLVTGACFAEVGHNVICVDNDPRKVEALQAGRSRSTSPALKKSFIATSPHNVFVLPAASRMGSTIRRSSSSPSLRRSSRMAAST